MILMQSYRLEEEIREKIRKEQQRRDSWEIDEQEYEDRFESIMTEYRLGVGIILKL